MTHAGIQSVLILGNGIAGPLAALAILQRTEISNVTIFEHRDWPATIGGAFNLAPNALRVLARLGVKPDYGAPTPSIFLQNEHGDTIGEVYYGGRRPGSASTPAHSSKRNHDPEHIPVCDFARGYEGTRVLRTALHAALLDALEPYEDSGKLTVMYGAKAVQIAEDDDAVHVSFDTGTVASADLLLGCDGIHSFARDQLYKDAPPWEKPRAVYSGLTMTYGILETDSLPRSYTAALRTHKTIGVLSRDHGLFTIASASNTGSHIYWFASRSPRIVPNPDSEEERPAAIRRELLETYGHFPPPCPEIIRATQKIAYWPVYTLDPSPDKWSSPKGRIVLLGDAAHPMPPFAAQGVGMAVEDAAMVANILAAVMTHPDGCLSAELWQREYQGRRESRARSFVQKAEAMSKHGHYDAWGDEGFKEWATWALLPAMSWAGSEKDAQGWAYDVDEDMVKVDDLFEEV